MYHTLNQIFLDRTSPEHEARPYLYHKPFRDKPYRKITNGEFRDSVSRFAAGLTALGVRRGDRIAIVSESRPEWVITDFACLCLGAITVPMFPTFTPKNIEYILAHSGAKFAVVSNDVQLSKVTKSAAACPGLEGVIIMNELWTHNAGEVKIHRFHDVSAMTASGDFNFELEAEKAQPDDVITIIYTSGTTGTPKGVVLTHHNLITDIEGALGNIPPIGSEDIFLSFLPLSHGFERLASYLLFRCGSQVAYAESIDTVAQNMLEIRPTIMTGVPRFFEKIHARLMKAREEMPSRRRRIFDWAVRIGNECAKKLEGGFPSPGALLFRPIADFLVLRKIRDRTGGRVRFFVSGGAALPTEIGREFAGFGLVILEGYGMTESSPVIAVTNTDKIKWGFVGKPLANIEVMIAPDGEILTRGGHVMKEYFKEPDATREAIDADGWLHTGDIGELDSEGYLRITDRKKHIFISDGGKNIAPGPIEQLFTQSRLIDQVMLVGDKRLYNTALIVPDFDALKEAAGVSLDEMSDQDIVSRDDIRDMFSKEIDTFQKELASYERVRRFALLAEPFSVENGLMTPTLKVKRKEVESRYNELIESLYKDLR
jgi:long-chain acyl-CoA synthetase